MKQFVTQHFKQYGEKAFALPTLIIISTTLMIISVAVLQGTLSVKTSLDNQYYDQLAKEAAEAGVAYANACIAAGAIISDNGGPLRTHTDCEGVSQRSNAYVVDDGTVRTYFWTEGLDVRADGSMTIKSEGYAERRKRNGGVFKTHQATVSQATGIVGTRLNAKKVVASDRTSFIIASDGYVYGAGHNSRGQLGLGDTIDRPAPAKVTIKDATNRELKVLDVIAGDFTTYFLGSDYNVYAVGDNYNGQLGIGNKTHQHTPVQVNLRDSANNILKARSIVSDGYSAYILASDNYVYSVGGNTYGELGIGNMIDQTLPVRMNLRNPSNVLLTAKAVYMSDWSTYVIASDDYAYAMGNNANGQLGIGTTTTGQATPVRVNLRNPSNVAITTREVFTAELNRHVFFLGSDNYIYSVGSNYNGELGTGNTSWLTTPQRMQLKDASGTAITATSVTVAESTYITGSDGNLYATGANAAGQLGNGTTTSSLVPVRVQLKDAGGTFLRPITVKAFGDAAVVLASDGHVYAFGENAWGGLGVGDKDKRILPTKVSPAGASGNNRIRDILIWDEAMFYINTDNVLYAAGYNFAGKLGIGNTTDQMTPQPVLLPVRPQSDSIIKVHNSGYSTVAISSDGAIYVAGANHFGQLGIRSSQNPISTPMRMQLKDASGNFLSAQDATCVGISWSCYAIASDGYAYAMGNNSVGQLGNGTVNHTNIPTRMIIKDPSGKDVMPLSVVGNSYADVEKASIFVLGADGYVYATGRNDYGQLGVGDTSNRSAPVRMNLRDPSNRVLTARKVVPGLYSTYILASDGYVYAVGRNDVGQLGDGTTTNKSTPVRMNVRNASNVALTAVDVVADDHSAFVIASDNQVYGTGLNNGTLGTGTGANVSTPTLMILRDPSNTVLTARSVITEGYATFVIASDNYVYVTGYNDRGQLGVGDTAQRYTPVRMNLRNPSGTPLTAIKVASFGVAGAAFVIASDNYVYAVGRNDYGQLGINSTTGISLPQRVQLKDSKGALLTAKDVLIEHISAYFIGSDDRLYATGLNDNGQLGVGDRINKSVPLPFKVPVVVMPGNRVIL